MDLKKEIKDYAETIGVDVIKFTDSAPLYNMKDLLLERKNEGRVSDFESKDIEERVDPASFLPEAKTIIVIGISYYFREQNRDNSSQGFIAKYSKMRDYHQILKDRMQHIIQFISQKLSYTPKHYIMVDTSPLLERAVALKAGVGRPGYNAAVINKDYGSYLNLGEILLDYEFEPDEPETEKCLGCNKCIEACPAGAIISPYKIDPGLCLSFWTQTKKDIPREKRYLLQNRIVGCDTCQDVCPHNKNIKSGNHIIYNLSKLPELEEVDLTKILHMTNRDFKNIFGKTAASWCGKRVLQRNALVAIGNTRNQKYVEHILPFLEDIRPQIRSHTAWSLGCLGGEKAYTALLDCLNKEDDLKVKEEINAALKNFYKEHKKTSGSQE